MTIQLIFDVPNGLFEPTSSWQNNYFSGPWDDFLIGLGTAPSVATTSMNDTVNSISTTSFSELIVAANTTFTATHGTVPTTDNPPALVQANDGKIIVDAGGNLVIGGAFDNAGVLSLGYSTVGGNSNLTLVGKVTLSGYTGSGHNYGTGSSGIVNLGNLANQAYTTGNIVGGGLVNVDNAIIGGGTINLTSLDNQSNGSIIATQQEGDDLVISASTFSNEGYLFVGELATLQLGAHGMTESVTGSNSGPSTIVLGATSATALGQTDAYLAIAGNFTIGAGETVLFAGSGAAILSDAVGADTLTNTSKITAATSGQIGDGGLRGPIEDLTLINSGNIQTEASSAVGLTGPVVLTLNTGANVIQNGNGTITAAMGGTIVIDSATTMGQYYDPGNPVPSGGTIEATSGGVVDIAAAVTSGTPFSLSQLSVPGQVVVDTGSSVVVESGGSVQIPIQINGSSGSTPGGVLTLQSGGAITGTITFESAGGTFHDTSSTGALFNIAGGGGLIALAASGSTVNISGTNGTADSLTGSGETINVTNSQVNVTGGGDTINGSAGSTLTVGGNGAGGVSDAVIGSNMTVTLLASSRMDLTGSGDTINAGASSNFGVTGTGDTIGLGSGDALWLTGAGAGATSDGVSGSSATVSLSANSRMDLVGSNDTVYAGATSNLGVTGTGDTIGLSAGDGLWLTGAGAGATSDVVSGSSATVSLSANSRMDLTGSNDKIYVGATSNLGVTGTGDTISLSSGDALWLTGAGAAATSDVVLGSSATVSLTANSRMDLTGSNDVVYVGATCNLGVTGIGDSINLSSGDALWLNGAGATAASDLVSGSSAVIILSANSRMDLTGSSDKVYVGASSNLGVTGTGDTINLSAGDALWLTGAGAGATSDAVFGSSAIVTLSANSRMDLTGSNDTIYAGANANLGVTGAGDAINLSSGDGLWIDAGTAAVVNVAANDSVNDGGAGTTIRIGSNAGTLGVYNFGADTTGVIDLLNGVGGYATAAAAASALTSDGSGGALLSLGGNGVIDFVGTAPGALSAANFKIG